MMKFIRNIAWLLSLLILSGIILHGAIPHHHHHTYSEIHTCCESHNHNDAERNEVLPCTILSSIYFENHKPEVQIYAQEVKTNHSNHINFLYEEYFNLQFTFVGNKSSVFVPQVKLSESLLSQSLSFRGPPTA